jgi:hypothetical protein
MMLRPTRVFATLFNVASCNVSQFGQNRVRDIILCYVIDDHRSEGVLGVGN